MDVLAQQARSCQQVIKALGQPIQTPVGTMHGIFRLPDAQGHLRRGTGSEGLALQMTCPTLQLLAVDAEKIQPRDIITVADESWMIVPDGIKTTGNGLISLQLSEPPKAAHQTWR